MSDAKKEESGLSTLAAFLLIPVVVLVDGFTLMKLWAWHVAPVTHWPLIPLGHCIGLLALWNFLKARLSAPTNDKSTLFINCASLIWAGMLLLIGWAAA